MKEKKTTAAPVPQENKMGVWPEGKLLANMAVPMMISMLFQALYNVVDSVFVGKVSQDAFNAVSLAFPLQMLMLAVSIGTGVGMNALLSRSLGEGKREQANRVANTGLFLFLCSALVFFLIGMFIARPYFLMQTKNPAIVDSGTAYVRVCLGCSVGLFTQFCMEKLLQSTGRTGLAMVTQIVGAAANIVLDPILIFGLLGAPRLEVAGAAVATVSGQILAALSGLILNLKYNPEIRIRLKEIRWDRHMAGEIYRIGIPVMVMQSIGSIMMFGMNRILISFTEAATAVFGAYFKLQSFIFMPVFGLNNGMVPILAYNYGAARPSRVKRTTKLAIVVAVAIMLGGMMLFELIPGVLLNFFTPSAEMMKIGVPALRIVATTFPFAGFCIVSSSVFQAIGNPVYSLVAAVCRQLVVLLPAAWLLAQTGNLTLVWLSFPIAEVVSLVMSSFFLRRTLHTAQAKMLAAQKR